MLWQVDVSALEKEDAELAERYRKLAKKYDTKFQFVEDPVSFLDAKSRLQVYPYDTGLIYFDLFIIPISL